MKKLNLQIAFIMFGCWLIGNIAIAQSKVIPLKATKAKISTSKKGKTTLVNNKKKIALPDTTLVLHVKLLEDVDASIPCGYNFITGIYNFEVVKMVKGYYPDKQIKIRFDCPKELGTSFFIKDKLYYFKVSKKKSDYLNTDVAYRANKYVSKDYRYIESLKIK